MSNWLSSLNKFFFERDRQGNVFYSIGSSDTDWELGDKLNCVLHNPVAFRCIDLISDLFSQAHFKVGENENHYLVNLINNPNPFQSKQDFLREYLFFKYAYGWVYEYPVVGVGSKEPTALFNLNPCNVTYDKTFATRLIFEKEDVKDIKDKQFKYKEEEQETTFNISEVIPFFDIANGLSQNFLLKAPSRLNAIQKNIKNIDTALCAENTALRQSGTKIVSGSVKGQGITRGMDPDDKKNIENSFKGYGNAGVKGNLIATNAMVDVADLHTPLSQLHIEETIRHNALAVMNTFGVPQELYPVIAGSGSKYDNFELAMVSLCQNVVQNQLDDYCNSFKSHFDIKEDVTATLDHLPCMQVIEDQKADKALKLSTAIRNLTGTNIDPKSFLETVGINMDQDE